MTDLSAIVRAFQGRRVLVVGDLILDRYLYGDAERISPEAPVPVLRSVDQREAVGGSANVAACLNALGCKAMSCGLVGDDAYGRTLQRLLVEQNVDTTAVMSASSRRTTTKTRLVGLAQHRHRQQLLRVDEEDTGPLDKPTARILVDAACGQVTNADVVCVEDYDKGVVTDRMVSEVLREAKRQGRPVLVDPARLSDFGRYRGVDILTPNRDELSIASGRKFSSLAELAEAGQRLILSLEAQAMIATVDRDGSVLIPRGAAWKHLPTVPRTVYDNTGAGDAVLAMLAASLAGGADLESAARLANIAGGLEVEKFGCVPISADEVLAELRLADRTRNGKLRHADELAAELTLRRDRGETVAFTNGCFDLLHAGHVEFLRCCRSEASVLIVGLNSDHSIRSLGKGPNRPIQPFSDRATLLGALECVDYVVGFDESTPETLIRKLRPDVLLKGEDWAGKGVVGREFMESIGGRVKLLPLVEGRSTTSIIERIRRG